ncbi:hypothetical protein MUK42_23865 [Musa troglodytarum]|uniref:Uncharacterized protein n=1 Tax=Musa troglodytarum TaxID=320322 RepID=A0A9E7ICZ0_9LILI|nr:hypothetical protein MUK42_23865 [Musa troglodytarum]
MWGELYVYDRLVSVFIVVFFRILAVLTISLFSCHFVRLIRDVEMEEKPALREWEPSDLDFVSTSNFSLQCSIGSHTANAKFEWVDYRPAVFRKLQEFGEIDNDDYTDSIRDMKP